MTSFQLIKEFIRALQSEIDALRKGKGGSVVKVFNGHLLRETSGLFVYIFHLENFLIAIDDTPAEIEVNGSRCQCQIISVRGMEVQIALERNLGQNIAEAKIWTNLWFLLELLRKKFEESIPSASSMFKMSEALFAGIASDLNGKLGKPKYTLSPDPLNKSQENAIAASFNKSLAIIWGPPGTGKTKTIAKAVEAHLNAGRRVLLVSHANTAVDEALEDIAEQLKHSDFYQEGKLIRLGVCHKATLEKKYPLVIMDNIAAKLGESLVREKNELLSERERIGRFLASCETLIQTQSMAEQASKERDALRQLISEIQDRLKFAQEELKREENLLRANHEKLARAQQSGAFKRLFLRLDPSKIQSQIEQLNISIDAKKRSIAELEQKYKEVNVNFKEKEAEAERLKEKFSKLLAGWGLTPEKLNSEIEVMENRRDNINSRISEIDKALDEIQKRTLSEARLVATTLTKTFTSKQFPEKPFDVLIVDESSMAPLPYVYWAASKASLSVTIVGDFLQLPPICVSKDAVAQKWLGRSIFDVLGITSVEHAKQDNRVTYLDTQYRMAPDIAAVPNKLFYKGILQNGPKTKNIILNDSLSGQASLVMVDTTKINPWCSHLSTGGRFNIYNALVATSVARRLLGELKSVSVGIITPYRAQARLISKIAKDWGILEDLRIDTVHRFQGGEEQIIIFDCVEGPGVSNWSMLDDQRPESDARLLLNVALTRAKCKVFLIAHKDHLCSTLGKKSIIVRIIEYFNMNGFNDLSSEDLVDNYLTADFEKWARRAIEVPTSIDVADSDFYTEKNFWPAFLRDIKSAKKSLIIMSPFVSLGRAGKLIDFFRVLIEKGVKVRVYTRPPAQQGGSLSEHAEQVIMQLEKLGATVIQRKGMHQKIAVIDDKIAWEGSLNILSHKDTQEQMRRFKGENAVQEVIRNLDLDKDETAKNISKNKKEKLCPRCLERGIESKMVVRKGRYGTFLGCASFPACRYTENISKGGKR